MRDFPGSAPPVRSGLLGLLRSWLQSWAADPSPAPGPAALDTGGAGANFYGSARVLVVDDDPVSLTLMPALMESRGILPWLAADGAEAVDLACELDFDLVLMDLQMPILDGWSATAAIRRFEFENSLPAVPIVAYSALAPDSAVLAAHGIDGSLRKPCDVQDLEDCLLQWCPTYRPPAAAPGAAPGTRRSPASGGPDKARTAMR